MGVHSTSGISQRRLSSRDVPENARVRDLCQFRVWMDESHKVDKDSWVRSEGRVGLTIWKVTWKTSKIIDLYSGDAEVSETAGRCIDKFEG